MAKNKQGRAAKAARYRSAANGTPSSRGNQNIASQFLPRGAANHGFSMADEARNTSHNHTGLDPIGKLRSLPVTFVSAGVVEPLKDLEGLCASLNDQDHASGLDGAVENHTDQAEDAPFFIDTTGDHSLARRDRHQVDVRSPSPDPPGAASDSSEEVVLFRGRKGAQQREPQPAVVDQMTIQVQTVEKNMQRISLESTDQGGPRRPSPPSPQPWQLRGHDDDDDLVADYIANMAQDDDDDDDEEDNQDGMRGNRFTYQTFSSTRDLGGSHGDFMIAEDEPDSDGSTALEDKDEGQDEGEGGTSGSPELPNMDGDVYSDAEFMDDETFARLLTKQEELGLDDDDLVLFSGEGLDFLPSSSKRGATRNRGLSAAKAAVKGKETARNYIPSASAVADVFDELDLTDWSRHNLPRMPKSKRGQPNFDHLDPEMAATLEATWQKDRLRKKERKQAREDLRAQGLLGKNVDPDDLRLKYPTGMTIDQIKEEMRTFLLGDQPLLTLTPMDSNARKTVHTLALKFNIKSKSIGQGDQRRPVLHRTGRTVRYQHVSFEEVFARRGRSYFHRMDVQRTQEPPRGGGAGGRRGINHAAFSYRDGEVVGGSAPELGQSNKGRNMLEKMGWSTGMALGATDNKGILQPVAHVVKRSKAGLG